MKLKEYAELDGCAAGELIASGEVTCGELSRCANEAVARLNPRLGAVIEIYGDALDVSDDIRPPPGASALWGVPMLRKDLMAFERGRLCENGSELCRGARAAHDSELFVRLRAAGVRVIGRATTAEFGYSTGTSSRLTGITRNPFDSELSAGGSSGGSAVAVASGMLPMAHGSDTGGSIRTPAGWTGLVGLKPTRGRVPEEGAGGLEMTASFALTRSVRDAAALLDVLSPGVWRPDVQSDARLRIGLVTRAFGGQRIDVEILTALVHVANVLEAMHHPVEPAVIALDWEPFMVALNNIWTAQLARDIEECARIMRRDPRAGFLQATIRNCHEFGLEVDATGLSAATGVLARVGREVERAFDSADVLLTPTSTRMPPSHAQLDADDAAVSSLEWTRRSFDIETFLVPFNISGHPAISLPLGRSASGLPIGVQLIARPGREDVLLQLAAALEQALPWYGHRPPLHVARIP
jgi:amidase